MTARQQAEKDIRESLSKEGRSFIAFRSELNRPIRAIVNQQLRAQRNLHKSYCLNGWAFNKEGEQL